MPILEPLGGRRSDLVKYEANQSMTRRSCIINNPNAAVYTDIQLFALPVGNITRVNDDLYRADLLLAAGSANVEGFILDNDIVSFAATGGAGDETTKRYAVLVGGPAVVNKDAIADDDPAGAAYDKDAIAVACDALPAPITVRAEPDNKHEW